MRGNDKVLIPETKSIFFHESFRSISEIKEGANVLDTSTESTFWEWFETNVSWSMAYIFILGSDKDFFLDLIF